MRKSTFLQLALLALMNQAKAQPPCPAPVCYDIICECDKLSSADCTGSSSYNQSYYTCVVEGTSGCTWGDECYGSGDKLSLPGTNSFLRKNSSSDSHIEREGGPKIG
jgi:hypothetical protein